MEYNVVETKWDIRSGLGNHRFLVEAPKGDYVRCVLPWRRHEPLAPEGLGVRILSRAGQTEITDILIEKADYAEGVILFKNPADGICEVYYQPFAVNGTDVYLFDTSIDYMGREAMKPSAEWLAGVPGAKVQDATVVSYEARTEHDSYYPMEFSMTDGETEAFYKLEGEAPFITVCENRVRAVRMKERLPFIWRDRDQDRHELRDSAARNEHYTFQIAVCAMEALENVRVDFYDEAGRPVELEKCVCFNTHGSDIYGVESSITCNVVKGEILPLWCGIRAELFEGKTIRLQAVVSADHTDFTSRQTITLDLTDEILPNNGDNDLWRMSRLFWLNSKIGLEDTLIRPYIPVTKTGDRINVLGKSVELGTWGLPRQVESAFDDAVQITQDSVTKLLSGPISFSVTSNGNGEEPTLSAPAFEQKSDMVLLVKTEGEGKAARYSGNISYEADGQIECAVTVTAKKDGPFAFTVSVPFAAANAKYMMGMCHEGGEIPSYWEFLTSKNRDGHYAWIGSPRGGMQLTLQSGRMAHYPYWMNDGKGTMKLFRRGETVLLEASTGDLNLARDESVTVQFRFTLTPFHPLDYERHWNERYYHVTCTDHRGSFPEVDRAKECGAQIINLHQGSSINKNINYPFTSTEEIKREVDKAHALGMRYKLYYTVRELSNFCAEIWALRALGNEILSTGKVLFADYFASNREGKGVGRTGPWLIEHLEGRYSCAWHQFLENGEIDSAVGDNGNSRFMNYYLEGLNWLVTQVGIDGLYLDGIGYNYRVMRRVRRILDNAKDGCRIDIHNGNDHEIEGYGYGCPVCTYLEHFAYADSLWMGEGYEYNKQNHDYWLTEIAGIPFGLMGDMLHWGGNPYKGMVFGMTARSGWCGSNDPLVTEIRKLWDDFDMKRTKMYGFWHENCPVTVENSQVKATAYVRDDGEVLVAVASWLSEKCEAIKPNGPFLILVNAEMLGLSSGYRFVAPAIPGFQEAAEFEANTLIPIEPNKGWLFRLVRE